MAKYKVYIVDVYKVHTVRVKAVNKKDACARVDRGQGEIAADTFDEFAAGPKYVRVEQN